MTNEEISSFFSGILAGKDPEKKDEKTWKLGSTDVFLDEETNEWVIGYEAIHCAIGGDMYADWNEIGRMKAFEAALMVAIHHEFHFAVQTVGESIREERLVELDMIEVVMEA